MNFNTVESQANFVFRAILKKLWLDYQAEDFEVFFDTYENLSDLGEVGEYFGDADQAIIDLGIGE